ncbi:MAG: UvrD-helicase domain-containing protein, partial [Alcanivorax sp.]
MTTQLTPEQQAVVQHQRGHARVIAVAGAGKTSTLTHFLLARLQEGLPAKRMLVLMYNKAAQQDFEQRLSTLAQGRAGDLPQIRTFHSLGLKIYQSLVEQGALPAWQGKILSDGEIEGVIWRLLQQIADDDTRQDILSQRRKWVEPALSFIDLVKSGLA